ncbi:lipooligosaccharide transport system permease protein [Natronocella acetinitrilica]|uniref:Transport permease protein n=1 Tax=Natronocella acetinitrilica TaxID=414046 RepID=A0AAE3G906_9GAMM|nr:ABC transporter permease [Natronocella acetinitrilica]MCP1677021.1 lipooligosaccharide transport system permease protein [Natronocella acetinitrilica]
MLPELSLRFIPIWKRNLRVWRKLMVPSILGNFGEPLLYLIVLGYGFGRLVGDVNDLPYMVFLASGIICSSAMFTASFEALYSAYTRMTIQQTWGAMLDAPLRVDDVVLGEIVWAATKALMGATAMLVVASLLGLVAGPIAVLVLPLIFLAGLCFGGCAMVITAISRSYDFFLYYFTLVMTPMLLLSGVFFPLQELPALVAAAAYGLPLVHVVSVARPLMVGEALPLLWPLHVLVVAVFASGAIVLSTWLLRRRLAS